MNRAHADPHSNRVLAHLARAVRERSPPPTGPMAAAAETEYGPAFLHAQVGTLLDFYSAARVRDDEVGGFHNQLRDDGSVYDPDTKHAVGTARYTVNYALAWMMYGKEEHKGLCLHGVDFLMAHQKDVAHGGFAWTLKGREVDDGTKWCYSVAFSLLALANAHRGGLPGIEPHIAEVTALAEDKYYEPAHGLYIDSFDRELEQANPYRGQNANMHMCEAMIALFEATSEAKYLERATQISHKLCVELAAAAGCEGRVCEHYTSDWQASSVLYVYGTRSYGVR
jgi:mannose/cellobiose epimerase-like protein (N-acyl-D-glucosamine 2-epimerase family)